MKWINWGEQEPEQGEAGFVIFYNVVNGRYWINYGTVITGPYWYDNEPIAWAPHPELPEEYQKRNEEMKARENN